MFDITDNQIEDLDDTSLRELIARLHVCAKPNCFRAAFHRFW
jgi:hypothetical protein